MLYIGVTWDFYFVKLITNGWNGNLLDKHNFLFRRSQKKHYWLLKSSLFCLSFGCACQTSAVAPTRLKWCQPLLPWLILRNQSLPCEYMCKLSLIFQTFGFSFNIIRSHKSIGNIHITCQLNFDTFSKMAFIYFNLKYLA